MKYTHCLEADRSILSIPFNSNLQKQVQSIIEKHRNLLCADPEMPETKPTYSKYEIYFNGKNGKDPFCFPPPLQTKIYFCDTEFKPYDLVVCEILLLLKYYFKDKIRIHTNGDILSWYSAIKEIKQFLPNSVFIIKNGNIVLFDF